ncbi:MAG: DNA-formamidopyrimidine glycosylase family protein [Parcubacteria group bacterium]
MPELPEVETIKRGLSRKIADKKITDVWVELSLQKKISPKGVKFVSFLKGKSIKSVIRRAKMLIFELSNGDFLLCHLKMTGQLVFVRLAKKTVVSGRKSGRMADVRYQVSDNWV